MNACPKVEERDAERERAAWNKAEASNLDIIGAYAPSDHLQLFEVGNTANDTMYVLASSRRFASIIAMMGGHIRYLQSARFWKPTPSDGPGTAVRNAINARLPGPIRIKHDHAIMHHGVFSPD